MKIDQSIRTQKVQQTGIYKGPGGDYRYIKAGDEIANTYTFSHKPGEHKIASAVKKV
jgi:hypothetical protein